MKQAKQTNDDETLEAARLYQAYENYLGKHRLYDFTDQIEGFVRDAEVVP